MKSSKRGRSYTSFYRDQWYGGWTERATESEIAMMFYIQTCPAGNGLGCFRAKIDTLKADYVETKRGAFARVFNSCVKKRFFFYDRKNDIVYLPKYIETNSPQNDGAVMKLGNQFATIPECDYKKKCYLAFKDHIHSRQSKPMTKAFKTSFAYYIEDELPNERCTLQVVPVENTAKGAPLTRESTNASTGIKAKRRDYSYDTVNTSTRSDSDLDVEGLIGHNSSYSRLPY